MKTKWVSMYMDMARRAAQESHSKKRKVGAIFVSANGVMSVGINGMPPGGSNECEYVDGTTNHLTTKPEVSHAEENLFTKMLAEGLSSKGGTVFCTHAPCVGCAKLLANAGIKQIWYVYDFKPAGLAYIKTHFDMKIDKFKED